MTYNPFIELARDPVGTLAAGGYALVLLTIAFGAVRTVLREWPTLWVKYTRNRHTDDWWAFGDRREGYIPPLGWSIRFAASLLVLAVAAFAASALMWFVGG